MVGPIWFSDHDEGQDTHNTVCRQLSELERDVKLGYYLYKAAKWVRELPLPFPG